MNRWWRMVLKVKVTVRSNEFSIEGDLPFSDVKPVLESWLSAATSGDQAAVDAIQARFDGARRKLTAAIAKNDS